MRITTNHHDNNYYDINHGIIYPLSQCLGNIMIACHIGEVVTRARITSIYSISAITAITAYANLFLFY